MKKKKIFLLFLIFLMSFGQIEAKTFQRQHPLTYIFYEVGKEYGIPPEILMAIGYVESKWDQRDGKPSIDLAYGIMGLREQEDVDTLGEAAKILNVSREKLKIDPITNIKGAAALLKKYAEELSNTGLVITDHLESFAPVIRLYSGMKDISGAIYVYEVYSTLKNGINEEDINFGPYQVNLKPFENELKAFYGIYLSSPDYPPAEWVPACSTNYTTSNRPTSYPINYVIIHVAQGSYAGTISWFQNCSSKVSAHYVMKSSDGAVTQMVRNKDIAWHAGNWDYNTWSIGIEHEGYVDNCSYFTEAMYKSSANLTRYICDLYGIPKDRKHIIGHNEVPGATHTDPGPCWDWNYYMKLVTGDEPPKEDGIIVDNVDSGFTTEGDWVTGTMSVDKYGSNYKWTSTGTNNYTATWKPQITQSGIYEVYIWYPQGTNRAPDAPFKVTYAGGEKTYIVNQQINGGKWNLLGSHSFTPSAIKVTLSNNATSGYVVIADAVKFVFKEETPPYNPPCGYFKQTPQTLSYTLIFLSFIIILHKRLFSH